jgi:hypothetical protein
MAAVDNLDRVIYNSCKLKEEQVLHILTSDKTQRELAREFDISDTAVQRIRSGIAYKHVLPDVPRPQAGVRRKGPTCEQCVHFLNDRCTMQFPEFKNRNVRTAAACAAFTTGRLL